MNCIIVDDEASSKQLQEFVSKCSSLNLVGTFNDSVSAMTHLSKNKNIDLAFIDIMSAGSDSFDRIQRLGNPPNIIVVSATGEFARQAFDYNVVDYLIKPVNFSRFSRAIDRTIKFNVQKSTFTNENKEVFIKKGSSLVKLKMKDIVYIEALENYVTLATSDKKFTFLFTMKRIEDQLPSDIFIRIHRSYIVNKRMINRIAESSLDLMVGNNILNLPLGKSYRVQFMNYINVVERNKPLL